MPKSPIPADIKNEITTAATTVWYNGSNGLPARDSHGEPVLKFQITKWLSAELSRRILDDVAAQFLQLKANSKGFSKHEIYTRILWNKDNELKLSDEMKKEVMAQVPASNCIKWPCFNITKLSKQKQCAEFLEQPKIVEYLNVPYFGYDTLIFDEEKQLFKVVTLQGYEGERAPDKLNWARAKSRNAYVKHIINDFTTKYLNSNLKYTGMKQFIINFEVA